MSKKNIQKIVLGFTEDPRYLIHQIDDLIREYFCLEEYKSSWIENWDKGDHIYIDLDKNDKCEDIVPHIISLRNKEKVSRVTVKILKYLCYKNVIPSGKYIVAVFW